MQSNNAAATEPMQIDKTIAKDPESRRKVKEPLKTRLGFENNKRGYDDFRVYHSRSKLTIDVCTRTPEEAQGQFQLLFYTATKDYDLEYYRRGYSFVLNMSDCQIRDEYPQFHGASFYFHIIDALKTCITNRRGNDNKENYRNNPDLPKRQRGRPQNPHSISEDI